LTDLLANFLLDLLKSFKEELLDFAALIQNDLSKCSDISELPVFDSQVFAGVDDVCALLLNNRLVLVANEFLLLFEVIHDLVETLRQNLDFAFVGRVLLFHKRFTGLIFLFSALVYVEVPFEIFVFLLKFLDFRLVLLNNVSGRHSIFGKSLVFLVDLALDLHNVCNVNK
jgi:hypothetical protein